jgi:hypothetical protein
LEQISKSPDKSPKWTSHPPKHTFSWILSGKLVTPSPSSSLSSFFEFVSHDLDELHGQVNAFWEQAKCEPRIHCTPEENMRQADGRYVFRLPTFGS